VAVVETSTASIIQGLQLFLNIKFLGAGASERVSPPFGKFSEAPPSSVMKKPRAAACSRAASQPPLAHTALCLASVWKAD